MLLLSVHKSQILLSTLIVSLAAIEPGILLNHHSTALLHYRFAISRPAFLRN